MKEVRPPKRPLIFYYCVAMLVLLLFNFLAMPWMARQQIREVDYGTFMDMAEDHQLGQVEIQEAENQIVFTDKDGTAVYATGMIPDPDLKQMLKDSGARFSGEVIRQTDPIVSFLLSWVLPIVIFIALGQYLSRRMMKNLGGPNAMAFGKSSAKVYVKSSEGIKFSDVAGEDEAKDNLKEIVEYLHDPQQIPGDRRHHAQGRAAGGPSGHRQDHAGQGRGRRGQCALLLHVRLGVRGDVRGHGRQQGPGPVPAGQGEGPLHRVHRRDRRHRQEAGRPDGRQRRAGADAEPAAHGDGRL